MSKHSKIVHVTYYEKQQYFGELKFVSSKAAASRREFEETFAVSLSSCYPSIIDGNHELEDGIFFDTISEYVRRSKDELKYKLNQQDVRLNP